MPWRLINTGLGPRWPLTALAEGITWWNARSTTGFVGIVFVDIKRLIIALFVVLGSNDL